MATSPEARKRAEEIMSGVNHISTARAVVAAFIDKVSDFAHLASDLAEDYPSPLGLEVAEEAQSFMLGPPRECDDELAVILRISDPEGCDDEWSYKPQAERFRAELAKRGLKIALVSEL